MVTHNLLEVPVPKPKLRSFNQQFIPKRLIELAQRGEYYESKML